MSIMQVNFFFFPKYLAQCSIVERLINSLMMHGRNNGKKLMVVRIFKHAVEIIHLLADQNPILVIVDAVINRYVCAGIRNRFSYYGLYIFGNNFYHVSMKGFVTNKWHRLV